jgi:N-acetylmuramoyl-L-alanine amidase
VSILISVAHSSKSQGAVSAQGVLTEYHVSLRASTACWRSLSGEFECELYDCGDKTQCEYDEAKITRVNSCMPELALELHCNAGPPGAQYSEVIYANEDSAAKAPGQVIAAALCEGFAGGHHKSWPSRGARVDDRGLFFLQKTRVPCLIVEGLFISNEEQAAWLATGGAETYGILVATGIKRWLRGHAS